MTSTAIGVVALAFGSRNLRETRDPEAKHLDWPGALSFTAMLSLLTIAVIQAPENGWSDPVVLGLFAGAAAMLALFVRIETRVARPMLDLSLFRYGRFVGVQLLPIATCFAYVVLLILLPLRFIGVEGYSESEAGLLMIALSAPMLVVPVAAAMSTRWISPGLITGVGLIVATAGLIWLGTIRPSDAYAAIGPMLVIGTGAGVPWGLMDGLAVSVVPKERAGMASGIFNTSKVASEGIILAIVAAALSALSATGVGSFAAAGIQPQVLAEIGHRLATGDVVSAALLAPGVDRTVLLQGYAEAFRSLTHVLAAITLLSALAAFTLLGGTRSGEAADGADSAAVSSC